MARVVGNRNLTNLQDSNADLDNLEMQEPNLPSNLTQDLGASTYQAPNFTQQNLGTRAFPHDPSVFDRWGNLAMEEEKGNYYEPPSGLATLKNWASNKLGTGINWGKMAISGIGNMIMPGLGWALGAINPGKLRGYNYAEDRYNTQEEYEAAVEARRHKARIDNMLDRRAAGKGFSQTNLNEATMGSKPGYYDNVWGGEGTGMTGGQQIPGAPTNLGQSVHGEGQIGGKDNQSGGGFSGAGAGTGAQGPAGGQSSQGNYGGGRRDGPSGKKAYGGRIGYAFGRGPVLDENVDENIFEFMQDQGVPHGEMVEGKSPFEMRIDELMDTGMSWQEAYEIASEEFGQIAEGESDQGLASIV